MAENRTLRQSAATGVQPDDLDTLRPSLYRHSASFRGYRPGDCCVEATVRFRPIALEDAQLLRDFFASHSDETIYLRYGMPLREMTPERAIQLVKLDGQNELALVGLVGNAGHEHIIAVGRYAADPETRLAEVALVVHES